MNEAGKIKPWMLVAVLVATALVVLNFDPVGDWLVRTFGKEADRWVTSITLVCLLIYSFVKKK